MIAERGIGWDGHLRYLSIFFSLAGFVLCAEEQGGGAEENAERLSHISEARGELDVKMPKH